MQEKRVSFLASEDVLRILAQRQQDTGASVSEIIRRALRKAYAEPAPVEVRNVQPTLLTARREEN